MSIERVGVDNLYEWSTSAGAASTGNTSSHCAHHLSLFFEDPPSLAIATEASSHPSGILALEFQPWSWAGGGLGNIAECPIQTCIAGAGIRRDSLTFASLCIVPQCTAHDLVASDFLDKLEMASYSAQDATLGMEYTATVKRITEINKFLGTGWICGDFVVPWTLWPFGYIFIIFVSLFVLACLFVSFFRPSVRVLPTQDPRNDAEAGDEAETLIRSEDENIQDQYPTPAPGRTNDILVESDGSMWGSFDVFENIKELTVERSRSTLILDGLRVGSICWIILGHVMAITASVAGFSNPKEVFPPSGYLSSVPGQLILSSRFAVDTFLIISGFLTFHVLNRKLPRRNNSESVLFRYLSALPKLVLARIVRILPLYIAALLFYTQIAPHIGSGPFWYQWVALLKPCHDYGWTNLLFINNFVPFDIPTTQTCFYHSWYLAVDMQLFLLSAVLVFWYQANPVHGKRVTALLWLLSLGVGTYLAIIRRWSINTFDGAAVARYDAEGYAKPHVRAQSYLTGVFVAMILPELEIARRRSYSWNHRCLECSALLCIAFVSFITYAGANSRRACQYQEWPSSNDCGSEWSDTINWIFASSSRTLWCLSIGTLMHLFLGRPRGVSAVSSILSWKVWVPLSRLSFAVYLIHPILIFMWELGSSEKSVFRSFSFGMNVVAICVFSYVTALVAVLTIEIPATNLWRALSSFKLTCLREQWNFLRLDQARILSTHPCYGSIRQQQEEECRQRSIVGMHGPSNISR